MAQLHDEVPQSSGSLRMREPAELAGRWTIATAAGECGVVLTTDRLETANAWAVADPSGCLARLVPGAVGWRPTPDGVALASAERRTLVLFAAGEDGETGTATLATGPATLRRRVKAGG